LRRTTPATERPYQALGYPLVPPVYVALATLIMLDLFVIKPSYTWPGLLLVLTAYRSSIGGTAPPRDTNVDRAALT